MQLDERDHIINVQEVNELKVHIITPNKRYSILHYFG